MEPRNVYRDDDFTPFRGEFRVNAVNACTVRRAYLNGPERATRTRTRFRFGLNTANVPGPPRVVVRRGMSDENNNPESN